jgi:hypothetical protein
LDEVVVLPSLRRRTLLVAATTAPAALRANIAEVQPGSFMFMVAGDMAMPNNLGWHIDVLRREIDVVKPTTLIICGGKAAKFFKNYLPEIETPLIQVGHYANRFISNEEFSLDFLIALVESPKMLVAKNPELRIGTRT